MLLHMKVRPASLSDHFNRDLDGDEAERQVSFLFCNNVRKARPFSGVLADRVYQNTSAKGEACLEILAYLAQKTVWPQSIVEDISHCLTNTNRRLRHGAFSYAFSKFTGGKSFEQWKDTIRLSDGIVAQLDSYRR